MAHGTITRRAAAAGIFMATLGFAAPAAAERLVRSLPHIETFDTNAYASDIVWVTNGGTHTWVQNGWKGGAAKFTPCLTGEGVSGLGQFYFSQLPAIPAQLNLRFLIFHGSTWREYGPGNKLVIMNREGNRGRPMIITREFDAPAGAWETWGACDGTVCRYDEGDFWPLGGDRLRIGNAPTARKEEWISVELEANTTTGMIRLYVDTLDGAMRGLYIERPMDDTGPGGTWSYIDVVGGYMAAAVQADPGNYFLIDELAIAGSYIGPPAGFGRGGPAADAGVDAGGSSGGGPNPGGPPSAAPDAGPPDPRVSLPLESEGCRAAPGHGGSLGIAALALVLLGVFRRRR
jgi:MYXO-CTERM domain-containing protein